MQTIKFKGDSALRKRFYMPESFQHPAKLHIGLFLEILARYCPETCVILDPMAGSGTVLLAAQYGHTVIANELEAHFIIPMKASWAKIQQNGPALGCTMGSVLIIQGDARRLPIQWNYPPEGPAVEGPSVIVTSPPYEGIANDTKNTNTNDAARGYPTKPMAYTRPRQVDAAIFSPPYAGTETKGGGIALEAHSQRNLFHGYIRPRQVDVVLSSPPYAEGLGHGSASERSRDIARSRGIQDGHYDYSQVGSENIGNLRGGDPLNPLATNGKPTYWSEISKVYAECFRVLKPGGIMALVLKGFTREGQYVDLPGQTEALLLAAGWLKHDEWRRELYSLSFWRILQKRRSPETWDNRLNFESVLAFRKPAGQGNGVDLVCTSPPYEATDLTKPLSGTSQGNATHKDGLTRRYTRSKAQVDLP